MKSTFTIDSNRNIDLICMGRVAVDLYAEQVGSPLESAETFRKYLGGCAGNIAVGTARLGLRASMFSCVGNDAMGLFLKQTLQEEKVDTSLLKATDDHLTGLVLLGVSPPDRFPLIFYRENCADMQLRPEDVDANYFKKSKALLVTGTGLSTPSMSATTHKAADVAKSTGTAVILDIDYRPVLWGLTSSGDGESRYASSEKVSAELKTLLPKADLVVGTEEEVFIAGGTDDLTTALKNIRTITPAPIVLKRGEKGCEIFLDDLADPVSQEPYPVNVLNVLGAGDAFMSGLLSGLLRGKSWETSAQSANACGAIVVSRHGCAPAMPFQRELEYFITHYHEEDNLLNSEKFNLLHDETTQEETTHV